MADLTVPTVELRLRALQLACTAERASDSARVLRVAESYFKFLVGLNES